MKRYAHWYVELHPSMIALDVTDHILNHLPQRLNVGDAIVICEQPERFKAPLSKMWQKVKRTTERLYASTLNTQLRQELTRRLELIGRAKFVIYKAGEVAPTSTGRIPTIWLVQAGSMEIPTNCATIYIMTPLTSDQLHEYVQKMPHESAIIMYRGSTATSLPIGVRSKH